MYRKSKFGRQARGSSNGKERYEIYPTHCSRQHWPRARVITVSSGKGGVGKTNIVLNLALALRRLTKKVMVMETNLGLGNINILLGKSPSGSIKNLLEGDKLITEIIYEGPGGISVLPANSDCSQNFNFCESQKAMVLNELEFIGRDIDLLLVDGGTGISSNELFFNLISRDSIVITTPEATSIANAASFIRMVGRRNPKKHFLALANMVQSDCEGRMVFKKLCGAIDQNSTILSIGYLGYVPLDHCLPIAVERQIPVLELFPEAKSSRQFIEIAKELINDSKPQAVSARMEPNLRSALDMHINVE